MKNFYKILENIETQKKELEEILIQKIKEPGINESARILELNKAYVSRFINGKQQLSLAKMEEIYKKLTVIRDGEKPAY